MNEKECRSKLEGAERLEYENLDGETPTKTEGTKGHDIDVQIVQKMPTCASLTCLVVRAAGPMQTPHV